MTAHDHTHDHAEHNDEISIGDLLNSLWRQRVPILACLAGGGVLGALILALMLAVVPSSEVTSLSFRLRFAGASEGTYPNGTPFQPADIVASSVVRPIYRRLDLEQYLPFEDLKSGLTVVESNEAMQAIRREFESKLANAKLTQAERQALEEEYAARRKAARTSEYRLQFVSAKDSQLPPAVVQTLLPAILEGWAEEAQKVKGAWLYDVAIPGQGLVSENDLTTEDYLVVVDMLRLTLQRVDEGLKGLAKIPGANLARAPVDDGLSIIEARARLEDLLRFKIEPLFAQVYGQGIFRDRDGTTRYLEHRLFKLGLDARALDEKSKSIREVLDQLGGSVGPSVRDRGTGGSAGGSSSVVIPQLGDGFMETLMEVGAKTADVEFRRELSEQIVELRSEMIDIELEQNLYQALLKGFSEVTDIVDLGALTGSDDSPEANAQRKTRERIERRFAEVTADSRFLIDQLQGLHRVISEQTLQPQHIYAVAAPAERSRAHMVTLRLVAGVMAVCLILGGVLAVLVAWLRESGPRHED